LTATPRRLDKEYLGFNAVVYGTSYDDLVSKGFLTPIDLYTVRTGQGVQLIEWMYANPQMMKKTIIFTRMHVEAAFFKATLPAEYKAELVLGNSDRETILNRYQNSDLNVLVSCEVLTEGTDLPCTETIILARGTTSKTLLKQMIGRGVRTAPNKTHCNVVQGVKMKGKKNHLLVSSVVTPRNHYIVSNPSGEWNTVKFVSEEKEFEVAI
jgi:superfamily II DNA or RNA helicase